MDEIYLWFGELVLLLFMFPPSNRALQTLANPVDYSLEKKGPPPQEACLLMAGLPNLSTLLSDGLRFHATKGGASLLIPILFFLAFFFFLICTQCLISSPTKALLKKVVLVLWSYIWIWKSKVLWFDIMQDPK